MVSCLVSYTSVLTHTDANNHPEDMVEITQKTKAIFVVAQQNTQSFRSLDNGEVATNFEFALVKVGDKTPIMTSGPPKPFARSGTIELEVEPGNYIVYVKLDQSRILKDLPLPSGGGGSGADSDSDSDSGDGDGDGSGDGDNIFKFMYDAPTSVTVSLNLSGWCSC